MTNPTRLSLIILACFLWNLPVLSQQLEEQFKSIMTKNDMMGGSLVVFCEEGIIENIALGKADLARNIAMTTDTKYRIASISKVVTAVAVMQLVEQELLGLDDEISTILGYEVQNPGYPATAITVRMLLSHTSTIVDGPTYSNFLGATVNDNPVINLSEILTPDGAYYSKEQFNNTEPGTYFNYSNINYVILGTLVEKVANMRFDQYCVKHISEPLGIDASFNVNDLSNLDQIAVLYRKNDGRWTPQADNYQGTQPVFDNLATYTPGTNGGRFGPQGGFRCSAKDLAQFFLVLMNGGTFQDVTLLSPASCEAMLANQWAFDGNNGNDYSGLFKSWGLGIHRVTSTLGKDVALSKSTSMFGHPGEAYGLVSDAYFDTTRKVGLVFMNNGVGAGYQTNNRSAFYTVEQEVFEAVENQGNINRCSSVLGINETDLSNDFLYPNPAVDFINIPDSSSRSPNKLTIFSVDGKKVKTVRLKKGETSINIKSLKRGKYLLELNGTRHLFIKE